MKNVRTLLTIIASSVVFGMWPGSSLAAIGTYFDSGGYMTVIHGVGPYLPFGVYIVLTDSPTPLVDGLEVAYRVNVVSGGPQGAIFRYAENLYGATGVATGNPSGTYDLNWATPRPAESPLILVSWGLLTTARIEAEIVLTEAANPEVADGLPSVSYNGTSFPVPIQFVREETGCWGCWHYPCASAYINVMCAVPAEAQSWGAVKSLYR